MRKKVLFFLLFILISLSDLWSGTTYYVDIAGGNDSNTGLTLATPWKSIAKANSQLNPGDTVYIRAGTYRETIAPDRSGEAGAVITYMRYGNENVIFTAVNNAVLLNNKKYIVIDGLKIFNVGRFASISDGSQFNIVKNCRMENATNWSGISISNSSHNKILNNYIYNAMGDTVELYPNADFNLIKGNEISGGPNNSHSCLLIRSTQGHDYSSYNVVQENYIHGAADDNVNMLERVDHNLVEGNIFESVPNGAGLKFCGGQRNIFRKNIVIECRAFGFGIYTSLYDSYVSFGTDNMFYNNVAYRSDRGQNMDAGCRFAVYEGGGDIKDNVVKNNIFLSNAPQQIYLGAEGGVNEKLGNNLFSHNIVFSSNASFDIVKYLGNSYPLHQIELMPGSGFSDNIDAEPRLANPGNGDFSLRPGSPAIDNGDFLTTTSSSGNGTRLEVHDARYFSDGFGVVEGDQIQLQGQNIKARITDIDYGSNLLTIDRSLTWYSGQGVSLPYSGFSPDIGAYELTKDIFAQANASPTAGAVPLEVNFTSEAQGTFPPFSFHWDFGDGEMSTAQNPSHAYPEPGKYVVTLTAKDARGNTEAVIIKINATKSVTLSLSIQTGPPAPEQQGGTTTPPPGETTISSGASVEISSTPYLGYRFSRWEGDVGINHAFETRTTVLMDGDKTIIARFCTTCGDSNGDLAISPSDAQHAFDIFLGRIPNPSICELENSDVNCDGTKSSPLVTPADARWILDFYLKKTDFPCQCAGGLRAANIGAFPWTTPKGRLLIHNQGAVWGREIIISVIVENIEEIGSFGFDLGYPQEYYRFIGVERSDYSNRFSQIGAHQIAPNTIRIGGYLPGTIRLGQNPAVLIALAFEQIKTKGTSSPFIILNAFDDLKFAQLGTGRNPMDKVIPERPAGGMRRRNKEIDGKGFLMVKPRPFN